MHAAGRRRRDSVCQRCAGARSVRVRRDAVGVEECSAPLRRRCLSRRGRLAILCIAGIKELVYFGGLGRGIRVPRRAIHLHDYTEPGSGRFPSPVASSIWIRGAARGAVCALGTALPSAGTRRNICGEEPPQGCRDIVSLGGGNGGRHRVRASRQRTGDRRAFGNGDFGRQRGSVQGSGGSGGLARPVVGGHGWQRSFLGTRFKRRDKGGFSDRSSCTGCMYD